MNPYKKKLVCCQDKLQRPKHGDIVLLGQATYPCPIRLFSFAQRSMTIGFTFSMVSADISSSFSS